MNRNILSIVSLLVITLVLFVVFDSDDINTSDIPEAKKTIITQNEKTINYYKIDNSNTTKIITSTIKPKVILPKADPKILYATTLLNNKFKIFLENPNLIKVDKNSKQTKIFVSIGSSGTQFLIPNTFFNHSNDINFKIIDIENNITNIVPAYFLDEISNNPNLDHFIKIDPMNTSDITYTSKTNFFN